MSVHLCECSRCPTQGAKNAECGCPAELAQADLTRLRALIKQAESVECYCPWCGSVAIRTNAPRGWIHKIDCPAFTASGEVR